MHRTNTTSLTTFDLPSPDAATFDFTASSSPASPDAIRITIPPSSSWRMPYHWHPSECHSSTTACERVTSLSGSLQVSTIKGISGGGTRIGPAGTSVKFTPGQRVTWKRGQQKKGSVQLPLTAELVADHALWRNICSAILERDNFPQLDSTPWWLKGLFAILAVVLPSWRNRLLNLILRIQLQTIFFAHDFHTSHGFVPVVWPWMAQPFGGNPPVWAKRLQLQSLYFIARAIMTVAYLAGTLFLGMKGEYAEYTPTTEQRDEKW